MAEDTPTSKSHNCRSACRELGKNSNLFKRKNDFIRSFTSNRNCYILYASLYKIWSLFYWLLKTSRGQYQFFLFKCPSLHSSARLMSKAQCSRCDRKKTPRTSCYNTLSGNSNDHISNQEHTKKHQLIPVYPDIDQSIANLKKKKKKKDNNPQWLKDAAFSCFHHKVKRWLHKERRCCHKQKDIAAKMLCFFVFFNCSAQYTISPRHPPKNQRALVFGNGSQT